MKTKNFVCLLVCLFAASTTTVLAEEGQYFSKSDLELGFHGSYNNISVDSENTDFIYADLATSYYLIDNFSIGANATWFYLPEREDFKAHALGLEGNIMYHFQINKHFVPYLGAHAGYYYVSADIDNESEHDNVNIYGAHGGLKVPINENVFFDTQLKWTDYDIPWDDVDLSATQILLGLKIKL